MFGVRKTLFDVRSVRAFAFSNVLLVVGGPRLMFGVRGPGPLFFSGLFFCSGLVFCSALVNNVFVRGHKIANKTFVFGKRCSRRVLPGAPLFSLQASSAGLGSRLGGLLAGEENASAPHLDG